MPQVNSVSTRSGAARLIYGAIMLAGVLVLPFQSHAQVSGTDPSTPQLSSRWEMSLDGRVGVPSGYVKVGEFDAHGSRLHLRDDLGIDVSGAVEGNLAFRLTPRDAIRGTLLYYVLDGSTTSNQPITYNGATYPPGHVSSSLDFLRLSLSYDRQLFTADTRGALTGSIGLTYVALDAVVHGNHEDFYLQELPVPIMGFRFDYPLLDRLSLTAALSGGALPRVDSLRKEGGTVYLNQSHADAGLGLTYVLSPAWQVHAGYHFAYFFQHEHSHEDNNKFELIDNAFQAGLFFRF